MSCNNPMAERVKFSWRIITGMTVEKKLIGMVWAMYRQKNVTKL